MKLHAIENYSSEFRKELFEASSKTSKGEDFAELNSEKQDLHIKAIDDVLVKYGHDSKGDK